MSQPNPGDIVSVPIAVAQAATPTFAEGQRVFLSVDLNGNLRGSGGTGGGGAVTVADGADITQGITTDAAVIGDTSGTVSAKLRGISKIFNSVWSSANGWLNVNVNNTLLSTRLDGSAFNTGQVSVGTTATQIIASNANRMRITIFNTGTTQIFVGGSGVTTSAGASLAGIVGYPMVLRTRAAIYGIVASGTQTVTYFEETT